MAAQPKTNAMRLLEKQKIAYKAVFYECEEFTDGVEAAHKAGIPTESTFKTLVCHGKTGGVYVFCIPVAAELDLKKAAKAVGEKFIELLPMKDILAVTGYIRGGCTPIGMKKSYPTVLHQSADAFPIIGISGGQRGVTLQLAPKDLLAACRGTLADLTEA